MDINPTNLDIIYRQAFLVWQTALAASPTWWQNVATEMPSASRSVDYAWMDRVPQMRRWIGPRAINSVAAKTRRLVNVPYEETIRLSKWDVKDDMLDMFMLAVQMQAQAAQKWPDVVVAQTIRDATSIVSADGTPNLGFDGVPQFSPAHPILGGVDGKAYSVTGASVQSNLFLNTPLTADNYYSVRTQMQSWLGADGLPLNVNPDTLMVAPALESMGKSILEADFVATTTATLPGGATQANATMSNIFKGTAKLFVNRQLADKPNNWWLFDSSQVVKPWIFQQRDPPSFEQLTNEQAWNVFSLAEFLYGVVARGASCESLWFLSAAGTSGSVY